MKYADSSQTAITTGGRFNVSSGYLDIIGVQLVDAGQYGCIAHNMHGKLVAGAFLTTSTCKYSLLMDGLNKFIHKR